MSRLRNALAVFGRATIWAPGAIPTEERKYAGPLKRVALPALDVLLIVGGYYAVTSGIPALDELLPDDVSNFLGLLFAACAVVCLLGAVFPRLWTLEVAGKILVVAILGMYFIALRTLDDDTLPRKFVSLVVLWGMVLPVLRLWWLGAEYGARHMGERRARKEKI
jgi:cytochrome bd-type quinol oxidase subunit 1